MTKYQRVEEWIVHGLENGRLKPGDLLPSEGELCEILSVGRNSVRTALNNLSHEGVVRTKKGIGTFCLGLRKSASMTIGFICLYSQEYIFPLVVRGCNEVLSRNGYHLVLAESRRDTSIEREVLDKLWKRGVDGIIIEPAYNGRNAENLDLLREVQLSGVPIVLVDNFYPGEQFNAVVMDDRAGGRLAASHLWAHGHRRVGIIYHRTYYPKTLRMQGAVEYLREQRVEVPEGWLVGFDRMGKLEEVHRRLVECFDREADRGGNFPTGFVCTNDEEAVELIKVAASHGLEVPRDISIVSFDNSLLADLPNLQLTSINHPSHYIGETATNMLLERIRNRDLSTRLTSIIAPELVERSSVMAPRRTVST